MAGVSAGVSSHVMPLPGMVRLGRASNSRRPQSRDGWGVQGGRYGRCAQVSSQRGVSRIVKLKLPLLDLWLVTGRRLRAGYADRYQRGYAKGWEAGSAEASPHAAEVHPHGGKVPDEGDCGETEPKP